MPISDIVNVEISTQAAQAQAAGFGKPLILGMAAAAAHLGTDLIRDYSSLAAMVTDGFEVLDPEYLAAAAIFAQTPRVPTISVGRRANLPTLSWDLAPTAANTTVYKLVINGQVVSYTSDSSATVAEITAGLKTAIDALAISGLTTTDNGGTTGKLHLAMGTAGAFLRVAVDDQSIANLGIEQTNADAGIAADLNAIAAVRTDWYAVYAPSSSTAEALALAAAVESFTPPKLCVHSVQDSKTITVAQSTDKAAGASGSAAVQMQTADYARSAPIYHPDNGQMIGAAWLGRCLPLTSGSETWKFKTLAGITAPALTDTQIANAKAKSCNTYALIGVNITQEGVVSDGEFIDVIRFRDWQASDMSTAVFDTLQGAVNKVPYTDAGIAQLENQVRASLKRGVNAGGLVDGSIVVTAPKAADVSSQDRTARMLNNLTWSAKLAGAIHATNITGTVTV